MPIIDLTVETDGPNLAAPNALARASACGLFAADRDGLVEDQT